MIIVLPEEEVARIIGCYMASRLQLTKANAEEVIKGTHINADASNDGGTVVTVEVALPLTVLGAGKMDLLTGLFLSLAPDMEKTPSARGYGDSPSAESGKAVDVTG